MESRPSGQHGQGAPRGVLNGGKAMNMLSLEQELKGNAYPGRGIVIGRTQDGKKAAHCSDFIMGQK